MSELALRRVAFRLPKPPSARTVYNALWIANTLAWLGKVVLEVMLGHPFQLIVLPIWLMAYYGQRRTYRWHRRLEERLGMAMPPPNRLEWGLLGFGWSLLGVGFGIDVLCGWF